MKSLKNIQAWLVLVAFVATVGILFGGQGLVTRLRVDNPLQKEIAAVKEVHHFKVESVNNGLQVKLSLSKVKDLQEVLDLVKQKVQFYQNKPVKSFVISDRRDSDLKQIKYQLSFYLEEATVSGNYTRLKDELESLPGVLARVYLTPDYVYLQLEKGNHYLYEAIPRLNQGDRNYNGNSMNGGESV
jgi:hypothetical protein